MRKLLVLAALLLPFAAPMPASASVTAEPPPAAATTTTIDDHVRKESLAVEDRAPLPASKDALRRDYDEPAARTLKAAACSVGDFTGRTGGALVRQIKASTTECVNTLFSLTGADAYHAFREAQMTSVAYALRDDGVNYPGDNSAGTAQLVLYLRAGYYVQWYNPSDVGAYGPSLRTAVMAGLDAFFGAPRAFTVSDANGEVLAEAVTLIDSAQQNDRYLWVVKRLLDGYDSTYDASWPMLNAVNNVYTVLFRGHQLPAFVSAVRADRGVLDSLYAFATRHLSLLGTDRSYLVSNAGRELGRFLQHADLRTTVRPLARNLLDRSSITGATAPLWVGVAEMADFYDRANCSSYGTCDLRNRLAAEVLPITHACGSGIRIRAQHMTSGQLSASCASLAGQDAYFHNLARDSGPVADDRNTTLEVVVYDSSTDYRTYAGAMFGIDTNNGGMYLEGDPAAAGNQPRFIAYEAEWLRPDFQIWNLNHEYTHYLDGRFTMYGDFTAGISTPTIWWIEGFAEYVSYGYRKLTYDAAVTEAAKGTYALSTLWNTTYAHDSTRVYRWGYLAVRYLYERHPADVQTVLRAYRTGAWNTARTFLTSTIGSRYDADWRTWLGSVGGGGGGGGGGAECAGADPRELGQNCRRGGLSATTGDYAYLYLYVPAGTARLTITSSGGTGDADLYYSGTSWATASSFTQRATGAGNAHTLTVTSPAEGYHYVSLHAAQSFSGATVLTEH
ncbi:M9 family metallopeptidase [Nonomuraea harbinensis]|uniref:microbial collagenase n=1 Tax=Nonomuraea harbinensis TaxID=1286938 RepID=A0ABW1BSL4_9ACTN|nr:M9 family metallopeptidase [Nonomuraea harbinensis]